MSGHDDNVRGLLDSSKQLREAAAQLEEMYLNTIDCFKMKGE